MPRHQHEFVTSNLVVDKNIYIYILFYGAFVRPYTIHLAPFLSVQPAKYVAEELHPVQTEYAQCFRYIPFEQSEADKAPSLNPIFVCTIDANESTLVGNRLQTVRVIFTLTSPTLVAKNSPRVVICRGDTIVAPIQEKKNKGLLSWDFHGTRRDHRSAPSRWCFYEKTLVSSYLSPWSGDNSWKI